MTKEWFGFEGTLKIMFLWTTLLGALNTCRDVQISRKRDVEAGREEIWRNRD